MATHADDDQDGVEVDAMMAVSGGPGGKFHQPIHESLTLAALINGNFGVAQGTTVQHVAGIDWEFARGAVWNDDPECFLFNDSYGNNHEYSTGATWAAKYTLGESEWKNLTSDRLRNPTGRSHYGDLQFLHSMASQAGETPQETKRKLLVWLEVMYKLANGEDGITKDTEIGNTKLIEFCPVLSLPPSFMPLSYLLTKESSYKDKDCGRRAIGSIFHVIQDSYAIGHTERTPLNPEDRESSDPLKYKPGTTDRWGAIENFHTYGGQNSNEHSHYDHANDPLPDPNNLGNIDQFNSLIGCRMAVDKCKGVMALKQAGKKWDDGVRAYFDEDVFALAPNATPANNHVL